MKNIVSVAVIATLVISGSASSFAMMENSMSMEHSMKMEGSMMKKEDSMMQSDSSMMKKDMMSMKNMSAATLAAKLGYNWRADRAKLAKMTGIKNYRGTVSQNIMIRQYLLSVSMEGVMVGGASMIKSRDIVDNAVRAKNVTTVVAAVKAAGLVDTLKSAGPFTVFAPTNDAFAKLPAGTVETLVKPENKATLVDILTYHVVSGKYKSSDLTDGLTLTTVEGKTLKFTRANGKLWINGSAMVETADVISTNGVTHVIDTVLMPQ